MKHSETPWTADQYSSYIKCGQRKIVCQLFTRLTHYSNHKANAKRIVACVNAMEGVEDPARFVEQKNREIMNFASKLDIANMDRNELLNLLKDLDTVLKRGQSITPDSLLAKVIEVAINK